MGIYRWMVVQTPPILVFTMAKRVQSLSDQGKKDEHDRSHFGSLRTHPYIMIFLHCRCIESTRSHQYKNAFTSPPVWSQPFRFEMEDFEDSSVEVGLTIFTADDWGLTKNAILVEETF